MRAPGEEHARPPGEVPPHAAIDPARVGREPRSRSIPLPRTQFKREQSAGGNQARALTLKLAAQGQGRTR